MALEQAALRVVPAPESTQPTIVVAPGQLARAEADCWEGLRDAGLYRQGRTLVRVSTPDDPCRPARALAAPWNGPTITPVTAHWLRGEKAARFRFQKPDGDRMRPVDPPLALAAMMIERADSSPLPELLGIVQHPTLRPDGSLLDSPGYDRESGLLYLPAPGVQWPTIPEHPTRDDAVAALAVLRRPLREFPFADPSAPAGTSESVALAGMITVCVRRALPTAPAFCFTAPTPGTGKSLLCDVLATVATGQPVPAMSHTDDPAEERKRLAAALLDGRPIVSIDNVERPLHSETLCSVLTQTTFTERVLGKSETAVMSTAVTVLINGNNVVVSGDLNRRVLMLRLDAGAARPDEVAHTFNPVDEARRHRGELVAAALVVVRSYLVAGCPPVNLRPFGSFDQWSRWVRSALVWAGCADPCAGRAAMEAGDPQRDVAVAVLAAWHDEFGDEPTTVAKCLMEAESNEVLKLALSLIPSKSGKATAHAVGQWIKRQRDRPYPLPCGGGVLAFRESGVDTKTKVFRWSVIRLDSSGSSGSSGSVSYRDNFEAKNFQGEMTPTDPAVPAGVVRYRLADSPDRWHTAIGETEAGLRERYGNRLVEVAPA